MRAFTGGLLALLATFGLGGVHAGWNKEDREGILIGVGFASAIAAAGIAIAFWQLCRRKLEWPSEPKPRVRASDRQLQQLDEQYEQPADGGAYATPGGGPLRSSTEGGYEYDSGSGYQAPVSQYS